MKVFKDKNKKKNVMNKEQSSNSVKKIKRIKDKE